MVSAEIPALTKGSPRPPPLKEGLRLYSSRFCPFAHRARLVLNYKQTPYEVVNIDLRDKPEWYPRISPLGKVPLLELTGDRQLAESLILVEYIDDVCLTKKGFLLPKDPTARALQKMLVEQICSKITAPHQQTVLKGDEDSKESLLKALDEVEKLLKADFFAGATMGFVDLMVWPWFDRLPGIEILRDMSILSAERYPKLRTWCQRMRDDPCVKECSYPGQLYADFYRSRNTNIGL